MIRRAEISNPNALITKTVTGSYTVTDRDDVVLVDATAGVVTVTLPDAAAQKNLAIYVKKVDSGGNAVTVAAVNAQTIDGSTTASLSTQYSTLALVSDGTNWQIKTVSASGTFTGGTITGATTVSVASATAFVVGPNGTTNPTLKVVTNTASAATGVSITSAAAGSGVVIGVLSSGANESLTLAAKGTGTISLQTVAGATGTVFIGPSTWGAGAVAQLQLGDSNHTFSVAQSGLFSITSIDSFTISCTGGGFTQNINMNPAHNLVYKSSTATPAGGDPNTGILIGSGSVGFYIGSGAPTLSAVQGSLYLRTDGSSTSTRLYVNTNGTTGWTNFTSAA